LVFLILRYIQADSDENTARYLKLAIVYEGKEKPAAGSTTGSARPGKNVSK
jgi:hypothetical protein